MSEAAWSSVTSILGDGVRDGVFPGAALIVGRGQRIQREIYAGTLGGLAADRVLTVPSTGEALSADAEAGPDRLAGDSVAPDSRAAADYRVGADTIYDLASLTKPLATTLAAMRLVEHAHLRWSTPVVEVLPGFAAESDPRRQSVCLADLLSHAAGLPAHSPYYSAVGRVADRQAVFALACAEPLIADPGSVSLYSDVGFLVLGRLVEEVAGRDLATFVESEIFAALPVSDLRFGTAQAPDPQRIQRIAPCGWSSWRRAAVHGVVHDDNAYAMGGVAPQAGLFGTARDVHAVVAALVDDAAGEGRLFSAALVEAVWRRAVPTGNSTWALGWDTPSAQGSTAGSRVSADAVGHLGFTGTSVWLDRPRGCHVVLLSNRVHTDENGEGIRALRPRLHDAVFAAVDEDDLGGSGSP